MKLNGKTVNQNATNRMSWSSKNTSASHTKSSTYVFSVLATTFFFTTLKDLLFGTSSVTLIYLTKLYVFFLLAWRKCVFFIHCQFILAVWRNTKCLWKCVSSLCSSELQRELMCAIVHIHVIKSILVFFLFSFEMLTTLKWVSLHITRTNQYKKPRHRLMVVHRSRIEFFVDLVHWQVTWWIRFGNELWT